MQLFPVWYKQVLISNDFYYVLNIHLNHGIVICIRHYESTLCTLRLRQDKNHSYLIKTMLR